MLDELLIGGEIQETSKKNIVRAITSQDMLQEVCCNIELIVFPWSHHPSINQFTDRLLSVNLTSENCIYFDILVVQVQS